MIKSNGRRNSLLTSSTCLLGLLYCIPCQAFLGQGKSIWEKIAHPPSLVDKVNPQRLQAEIKIILNHKKQFERLSNNTAPYLEYIYQETRRQHLPAQLALLPMLESHFEPFSYSQTGATGLWQMMPGTAAGYGLAIDWWYDARRDTIASTQAALHHLKYLHRQFNDWLLAIAAYNAGEGRVRRAMMFNLAHHQPTNFWSLKLPAQTKRYVPRFLAYAEILSHPKLYGLHAPELPARPTWVALELPNPMHLSHIASLAEIDLATLRLYNPGYRRDITGPHYRQILIPTHAARRMQKRLSDLMKKEKSRHLWLHHTVRHGDTLGSLAKKYHTTVSLLKIINRLHNDRLTLGQTLYVLKKHQQLGFSIKHASNINPKSISETYLPGPKQIRYQVKKGEGKWSVSKKFHVKIAQLVYWNGLGWNEELRPGQRLVIWKKKHHGHQSHRVKRGDTLSQIALNNDTSVAQLKRLNHLHNSHIHIGQHLVIR